MKLLPYNPIHINTYGLGSSRFARRYSGYRKNLLPDRNGQPKLIRPERKFPMLLSFPPATVMFHFTGCAPSYKGTCRKQVSFLIRTSRDITIIWHLPRAYRSHTTSFFALWSQGIHHTPFIPIGNAVHRCTIFWVCVAEIHTQLRLSELP